MENTIPEKGPITEHDRERFENAGITLTPGTKEKTCIQKFYLYLHMTKPTEELTVSFSKVSAEGKSLRPSYLIGVMTKSCSPWTMQYTAVISAAIIQKLVPELTERISPRKAAIGMLISCR